MSREIKCDNKGCPAYGTTFVQMTDNDGSCGLCGKTPKPKGVPDA